MTYTAAAVLGIVAALGLDVVVLRTRLVLRRVFWVTYSIIIGFQLLLNGVLTSRGVVLYRADAILGPRIFSAPIEDILFGFALILASLSIWVRFERSEVDVDR